MFQVHNVVLLHGHHLGGGVVGERKEEVMRREEVGENNKRWGKEKGEREGKDESS